jgi:hypothetical protein
MPDYTTNGTPDNFRNESGKPTYSELKAEKIKALQPAVKQAIEQLDNLATPTPIEQQVVECFGDNQQYDGGWFADYDGKWIDITNDVTNLVALIESQNKRARLDEIMRLLDWDNWDLLQGEREGVSVKQLLGRKEELEKETL